MSDFLVTKSVLVTKLPRSSVDEASLATFFEPSLQLLLVEAPELDDGGGDHVVVGERFANVTKIEIFPTRSKATNCHALVTVTFTVSAGPAAATQQFKEFVGHARSRLNRAFPRQNAGLQPISEAGIEAEQRRQRQQNRKEKRQPQPKVQRTIVQQLATEFLKFLKPLFGIQSSSYTLSRIELERIFDDWLVLQDSELQANVDPEQTKSDVFVSMSQMGWMISAGSMYVLYPPSATEAAAKAAAPPPRPKGPKSAGPQSRHRQVLEKDKNGVSITCEDVGTIAEATTTTREKNFEVVLVPPGQSHEIKLSVCSSNSEHRVRLSDVTIRGRNKKTYSIVPQRSSTSSPPFFLTPHLNYAYTLTCRPPSTSLYRASIWFTFQRIMTSASAAAKTETFYIVKFFNIRAGDAAIANVLKVKKPYSRKKRRPQRTYNKEKAIRPPKSNFSSMTPSLLHQALPQHRTPHDVGQIIVTSKAMDSLFKDELYPAMQHIENAIEKYTTFWQYLLWQSENQARRDITLFDMDRVTLPPKGTLYTLTVPGLAEGRPSVLRGDILTVVCKDKHFLARVVEVRQLTVHLELARSFSNLYHPSYDTVDVRFTLSRTIFRTSHQGCVVAPQTMGRAMLFPEPSDAAAAALLVDPLALTMSTLSLSASSTYIPSSRARAIQSPSTMKWGNPQLNQEQKNAVFQIVQGAARPLPYIIFGCPGGGKSVTVTEVIYQLTKLSGVDAGLRILAVAPSNDAADALLSKLAQFFPPTELRRILAYSRSVETVPSQLRPYCSEGNSELEHQEAILSSVVRVVVSTVNLAARFSYIGIPKGHFDVLCVDEAGHATEPEVIAVAATLMNFGTTTNEPFPSSSVSSSTRTSQVILAGDPKQLGPVIASDLCEKYGMSMSYMERLTLREAYGRSEEDNQYPAHLLTKLVRNYRSHPAIVELPNQMFYEGEMSMVGDPLSTHSLARWEHLPVTGFPIVFDAVHGENLREEESPSWFNPQEAAQVVHYVKLLVTQTRPPVAPKDIGIITPYNRQAQKIRAALKASGILSSPEDIKVGSVETFQGQERRVIILSTVRAENELVESEDKKYNLGFVANEKRFNVAMTRAKALLIVIGHPMVLATDEKNWLPLLRLCKEKGAWLGEEWNEDDEDDEEEMLSVVAAREGDTLDENSSEEDWVDVDADDGPFSQQVEQGDVFFVNREE